MRIDDLILKLEGPMSKAWQENHDLRFATECRERNLEKPLEEIGNELCSFAKRELAVRVQKLSLGNWCGVTMNGPGYILNHSEPRAIRKPYLRFNVSIGGNSCIQYNHWPKNRADIEAVCDRIAEAVAVLKRLTSDARTAT